MKTPGFIRRLKDAITDYNRDFSERIFLILTIISECVVLIALIADIILGEHIGEILVLTGTVIFVPVITVLGLYKDRIKDSAKITVTLLVLLVMPLLFFFGGGLEGGSFIWFIFSFMYVGLVLTGRWRNVFLVMIILLSFVCFITAYYNPQLVIDHSRSMRFIDTYLSVILVGIVCFFMAMSQNSIFQFENKRAKKETERAEELTRSQNRFFSSMSHEIRTPINSILGLNELILRDPEVSNEVLKDASGIQGAGKLLLALINDILDFSKMEAGSMDIVPVDYNIGDMLSEIVNMIWLKATDKGLKFNVSIAPDVPAVLYGDEVRIKQVVINILNNAVKYTKEGSVELSVECESIDQDHVMLSFSVSDTGMGIKKEALPDLFNAFKRVDEEKNRNVEGTGLGLSIVKQLVDLMDGTVSVNSVYGEGSTFVVTLKQGVTDSSPIGDLNIHNQQVLKRDRYESSFRAPDGRILIVDDNEMNLEVERKLLTDTQLKIDTALDGKEALEMTLKYSYDVILMDHLMPEMDGIECLEIIREQTGGLNRNTPVVVLTANAGSENRELYNRAGFDGYLVKPVSGINLENALMNHIRKDKLIISRNVTRMSRDINTTESYVRKAPVIITCNSMSDIPDEIIRKLNIRIIPTNILTEDGIYKDGLQIDANELIRYINDGHKAVSSLPDVNTYTEIFANSLKKAHHLIHISLTTSMSRDYYNASEAAKAFDNVTVINSECISSATGMLVLIAHRLIQQNYTAGEIVEELEKAKQFLRCSFVIDTTEYMTNYGFISKRIDRIAKSLSIHFALKFKNDRYSLGGLWLGSTKSAYKKYIRKAFPVNVVPDRDVVFITYADVPINTLMWIKEEIEKIVHFDHVVFQQASAAISSNCGPGTIGILYMERSGNTYNISSYINNTEDSSDRLSDTASEDENEDSVAEDINDNADNAKDSGYDDGYKNSGFSGSSEPVTDTEDDKGSEWYRNIDLIDGDAAIKNSGSEEAFRSVLKIFYDSVSGKISELKGYYEAEDWNDYTIKIHALKSSSKLIGALGLSDKALLLETAGKEGNTGYIKEHHEETMQEFLDLREQLSVIMDEKKNDDKPLADEALVESVYEELRKAADSMDTDTIEEIFREMEDYSMPDDEKDKYEALKQKALNFDYEGMIEILDG